MTAIVIILIVDLIILALSRSVLKLFNTDVETVLNSNVKQYHGFDWDAYWKDVENGVDTLEQINKKKRGDYWITK